VKKLSAFYRECILTLPAGPVMSHWQLALSGYVDVSYPGDWMVPELAVYSGGVPLQASAPTFKTIYWHGIACCSITW